MNEPIRVLLADDHNVVRGGIRALIEAEEGIVVIDEACDGVEAVLKAQMCIRDSHSTGFFRAKTQSIRLCAKKLCDKFGGQVPQTMPELLTLRGVARKTANCVLGSAFGIPSGVVVDTHIARLSARLGLTKETDPVKIEKDLMARWPQEQWIVAGHRLIWHGRRVCAARKPACDRCSLVPLCPSAVL